MASAIKIIYLLQTINILYKMSFDSLSVSTLQYTIDTVYVEKAEKKS